MNTTPNPYSHPPLFKRGDLAKILGCSTLTISNQEKSGKFPPPRRLGNDYRVYTLKEVFDIQLIYKKQIEFPPLFAVLWEMGYTSPAQVKSWINSSLEEWTKSNKSQKDIND